MGVSSSSVLDENKSDFIRGQADAELRCFDPHYRRQWPVVFFTQLRDEVQQHWAGPGQLLSQLDPPAGTDILYGEKVLHFDDTRKWKERFVVVRADYSLEFHDSYEVFMKGLPPRHKMFPTGGTVLTSEEEYVAMLDKCLPDPISMKDESIHPVVFTQGQFPIYLKLPYLRDSCFCCHNEEQHTAFVSMLSDCIRHHNHVFLKNMTHEEKAFVKAIQFYRQEKGHYESWEMLVGSEVLALANLVMEELLPALQVNLLPCLKGKKADKRKAWSATVEAAYLLVQDHLGKEFAALKEECRETVRQQEAIIRSHMDQISDSQAFLAGKLRATMMESTLKFCSEHIQPYLASVLEEIMSPVSSGFQELRQLCDTQMDQLCQHSQEGSSSSEELNQALEGMRTADLQDCYRHMDNLQDKLLELCDQYNFSKPSGLVQRIQIDMQQLLRNASYTFELLLHTALKDNPAKPRSGVEKAKLRVLKQYDYDSSSVRKRILRNALVEITLPAVERHLAPTYKPELHTFDQYIFADYSNFIQVENVYEDVLLQILEGEITKVLKEVAHLKKHNKFMDYTDLDSVSQSSLGHSTVPSECSSAPPSKAPPCPVQRPEQVVLGSGLLSRMKNEDYPSETEGKEKDEKERPSSAEMEEGNTEDNTYHSVQTGTVEVEDTESSHDEMNGRASAARTGDGTNHLSDKEATEASIATEALQTEKMEVDDKRAPSQTEELEVTHTTSAPQRGEEAIITDDPAALGVCHTAPVQVHPISSVSI